MESKDGASRTSNRELVSSLIVTPHQPHRVTSGWIKENTVHAVKAKTAQGGRSNWSATERKAGKSENKRQANDETPIPKIYHDTQKHLLILFFLLLLKMGWGRGYNTSPKQTPHILKQTVNTTDPCPGLTYVTLTQLVHSNTAAITAHTTATLNTFIRDKKQPWDRFLIHMPDTQSHVPHVVHDRACSASEPTNSHHTAQRTQQSANVSTKKKLSFSNNKI